MDDTPIIGLPGSKMKIERIPMSDEMLRLECLKHAVAAQNRTASVERIAGGFESYVRYGRKTNDDGYLAIAPELFANNDETVISFRGATFYRACNNYVSRLPDGGASHCVKRVGHPSKECEDFEGRTYTHEER